MGQVERFEGEVVSVPLRLLREIFDPILRPMVLGVVREVLAAELPKLTGHRVRTTGREDRQSPQSVEPVRPEWYSRQRVATITGFHVRTISRWIEKGFLTLGGPGRNRIHRYELDRLMDKPPEQEGSVNDEAERIERLAAKLAKK